MAAPNFDVIKEIPGYKVILKTVLKAQIQLLVKQLEEHTDEQSVILTASMGDGTLSHLGSDYGQSFLNDFEDFKFSFLGFCLKKHNKKQLEDQEAKAKEQQLLQEQQIAQATQTPIHINPAPPSGFSNPSPGGRERVMKPKQFGSSVRHEPYPITRPQRTGFTVSQTSASAVKLEPSFDNENNSNSSGVFPDGGDVFQPHSGDSNSFTGSAQVGTVDQQSNIINAQDSDIESIVSGALVQIKREVEDDLEITGVEPGIQPPAQDAWGSSASSDACPADTSAQQAYRPIPDTVKTAAEITEDDNQATSQVSRNVGERTFRYVHVDQFLVEHVNKNTKKKTESDLKVFRQFLSHKDEQREIEHIPPDELNDYISEFLLSVTKQNGEEYEPTSLRSFVHSIDRHLKGVGSRVCVINDIDFAKCRGVLKNKLKALKRQGLGNKPKAADALTDEHIKKMYDAKTLGPYTARSLIHSMWFICATFFGMRTGTEIYNLKWGDVIIDYDKDSRREYLQLCIERQAETCFGANARNSRQNNVRAYAVAGDSVKDPVHLYKTYRDKRPVEMLRKNSPFFLSISTSDQVVWFKKTSMGVNKLYNIMNEMKADAGIAEPRLTPNSARKRMVKNPIDEGSPRS
ncbi:uncharacterized protein LOC128206768 isoform X1 [Mya arenaria]|uniref:uncharacterized protein LOC128206768 isoform X1 n=1 Tax=Mya arenaria TaxID=6604 RepID=UPI0022E74A12|nr:uncharacterized protein LOC128206768 isoform X1 [Mya arenaria]XP_052765416.1 uncharacterized protein LOC128206768 isoform X1 [Mya arenaria]